MSGCHRRRFLPMSLTSNRRRALPRVRAAVAILLHSLSERRAAAPEATTSVASAFGCDVSNRCDSFPVACWGARWIKGRARVN